MSRRPSDLATFRRVVAWGLVFIGGYVFFFGVGYQRVPVMLAGVAIGLLAATGKLVSTLRGAARQWVPGTGQVLEVSAKPENVPFGRCEMVLAIDAPGLPNDAVTLREPRVPVSLWPTVGDLLPIEVAADDIRRVRILWPEPEEQADEAGDDTAEAGPDDDAWDEGDPLFRRGDRRRAEAADGTVAAPLSEVPEDHDGIDFALDGPPTIDLPVVHADAGGTRVPRQAGRRPSPVPRPAEAATVVVPARDPADASDEARPSGGSAAADDHPAAAATPPEGGAAASAGGPETAATVEMPRAGAVRGVGVTLLVRDLEVSRRFYMELLGFAELDRAETESVLIAGDTILVLRQSRQLEPVRHRVVHLHVEVDDVGTAYERLREAGVRFTSPPRVVTRGERMEQWAAAFRDPDGHGIAITRWRRY